MPGPVITGMGDRVRGSTHGAGKSAALKSEIWWQQFYAQYSNLEYAEFGDTYFSFIVIL